MNALRKGQKVRMTVEGRYFPHFDHATVETSDGLAVAVSKDATIELIEDLRLGDVYRATPDDEGQPPHVVTYVGDNIDGKPWYCLTCGQPARDFLVPRPLILLVRDGQVVA